MELIDKTKLLVEIKRRILEDYNTGDKEKDAVAQGVIASLKYYIEDTLEVKEVNLSNSFDATVCKIGSSYLKEMDRDAIAKALEPYKDGDKVKVIIEAQKGE